MYLAIELQSLCFYVIAASRRDNEFSVEAGLKYFILGALSSGLLLFGESIVYGFTGITNFEEFSKFFPALASPLVESAHSEAPVIGVLFIFVAFLFKIGAVPFHM
jgi:NADH:ubiquinone oxidoreductase subunit 2 (subunit N)